MIVYVSGVTNKTRFVSGTSAASSTSVAFKIASYTFLSVNEPVSVVPAPATTLPYT